jgi:hypothetical protein
LLLLLRAEPQFVSWMGTNILISRSSTLRRFLVSSRTEKLVRLYGKLTQAQVAIFKLLRRFENFCTGKHPSRMMRRGREVDDGFQPFHRLYYRFDSEDISGDRVLSARTSFDLSTNWAKYSWPWDVIYGYPTAGIAMFFVRDICADLPTDRTPGHGGRDIPKVHSYRPIHEPIETNYSHTAIACFKDEKRVSKSSQVGESTKKEFRQLISDRAVILREPTA